MVIFEFAEIVTAKTRFLTPRLRVPENPTVRLMSKLVVGCGYLGMRVARLWAEQGARVFTLTRSARRATSLREAGFEPLVGDVTVPGSLGRLPRVDTVLYAVGFDRAAGKPMREVYVTGLSRLLDALPTTRLPRIIYISSTGVYGQTDGGWVDEDSATCPRREGGRVCLEAEGVLRAARLGRSAIVLRLAGLYGPGRIPRRDVLAAGQPIAADPDVWLNLIHVDDAACIVALAARRAPLARTYTVTDGRPAKRREFYETLSRLIGVSPPRFEPGLHRRGGGSNRRVSNRRLMRELAPRLRYPSFRVGLAEIVGQA